jgi:predicted RNA-binding Zn-ribbon protein involved in translation (DUF1610 family)
MSDRKYRHRGYRDDDRPEANRPAEPRKPAERPPREMRAPNLPAFGTAVRCARCGHQIDDAPAAVDARCAQCGTALHACVQCASFDTGLRFECAQPISARITPKDAPNDCRFFEPRVRVERQTRSAGPDDARSAFDRLFKL